MVTDQKTAPQNVPEVTPPRVVTPRELRRFLVETVNLPDLQGKDDSARTAWIRFTKMFEPWIRSLRATHQNLSIEDGSLASPAGVRTLLIGAYLRNPYAGAVSTLATSLRRAWEKPTRQEREEGVLTVLVDLAQLYATGTGRRFALAQEPIGRALLEAIHAADLMRVCLNPECPARYFIAARRSQKFCSEKCAEPAQREYKRRWWSAHGADRAKARKRAANQRRTRKAGRKRRP